jgi:hypothetical protein
MGLRQILYIGVGILPKGQDYLICQSPYLRVKNEALR